MLMRYGKSMYTSRVTVLLSFSMKYIWIIRFWIAFVGSHSAAQRIAIYPDQDTMMRPIERNTVFSCLLLESDESVDPRLKWFNPVGVEITETSGRVFIERVHQQSLYLYITSIQSTDAGTYECRGLIERNEVSDTIRLEIYQDITFTYAPTPQNPVIFTDAMIQCEVTGQPAPEISWRYRGIMIENDERYNIEPGLGLTVKNITEDDNGQYECRAEVPSDGRFDKRDIDVVVYTHPKIVEEIGHQTQGVEFQEVSISCSASGRPPPTYEFYRDGNEYPVEDQDDRVMVDHQKGVIYFRPLDRGDQGFYRCEATNALGVANSEGYLNVIIPPRVYEYRNRTFKEGETGALTCLSEGEPSPDMAFRKVGNGYDYETGENENGRVLVTEVKNGELKLEVFNLIPYDSSNYTCKSRNEGGLHEQNGTIIVEFAPRFPEQQTEFYGWTGKRRNVTCFTLSEPEPEIEWWQYNEQLENNETFAIHKLIKNSVLQITVREEDSTWIYSKYTCRARNQHGENDFELQLLEAMVPDPPAAVTVREETPTTLILDVESPEEDGGVPIIGYRVSFDQFIIDYNLNEVIRIENLRSSTRYMFRVRARNEVGSSDAESLIHEMLPIQEPYPIVIVSEPEGLYPFEYTLIWEKPRTGGLTIEKYQFKYRKVTVNDADDDFTVDDALEDWVIRFNDDDPNAPMQSYTLEGLTPNQHYQAEIQSKNDIGWSIPNEEFVFLTAQDGCYGSGCHRPREECNLHNNCTDLLSGASAVLTEIAEAMPSDYADLVDELEDVFADDILSYPFAFDDALFRVIDDFDDVASSIDRLASGTLRSDCEWRVESAVEDLNAALARIAQALIGIRDALPDPANVPPALQTWIDNLARALAARNDILGCFATDDTP